MYIAKKEHGKIWTSSNYNIFIQTIDIENTSTDKDTPVWKLVSMFNQFNRLYLVLDSSKYFSTLILLHLGNQDVNIIVPTTKEKHEKSD